MTAGSPERLASMARAVREPGAPTAAPMLRVRFVADLVCPWCFISFRRLRRLLDAAGLTAEWHPFLLNPHLPAEGVARSSYLERKFGSLAQAQALYRRLQEVGNREGIDFAFSSIRAQPNTVQAHTLVLAAADQGRALEVAAGIFEAFFEQGADIGDAATLAGLARQAGLGPAPGGGLVERVARAHDEACRLGINGVPIVIFGADHLIAGAQPVEALQALLDLERYRSGAR